MGEIVSVLAALGKEKENFGALGLAESVMSRFSMKFQLSLAASRPRLVALINGAVFDAPLGPFAPSPLWARTCIHVVVVPNPDLWCRFVPRLLSHIR